MPARSRNDESARASSALFTDLYELTMLRAYGELGMRDVAVFDLFFRKLPPGRNYLIACGLDTFLKDLETLAFDMDDLIYLSSLGLFPKSFLDSLKTFRFTGTVRAIPEGTTVFPNEPLLEIVAPIGEAQVVETLALNRIGLQTILASKAARVVEAAKGRPVVDFGGRRAQGIDAAIMGARAFFIAGVAGTSNVEAAREWGIPAVGTMAHSFIEACTNETEAFRAFTSVFPETILLVDTYDTLEGVRRVAELARRLGPDCRIRGVRLDSGNLGELAKGARAILDKAGLHRLQIFASGGLDEGKLSALIAEGAPIDAFGVGTSMSVSSDAPSLDLAYKLVEYAGLGRMKLSTGKRTLPDRKQVFRSFDGDTMQEDVIAREHESLPGTPLLETVMVGGRRVSPAPSLAEVRDRARASIESLPPELRALEDAASPYSVTVSQALQDHEQEVRRTIAASRAR